MKAKETTAHLTMLNWLILLVPLTTSISFAMDVFIPSLPDIALEYQTTPAIVQWTLSIFMFGVAFSQLVIGPLADRYGKRRLALWSCAIFLVGSFLCAIAPTIEFLILSRLLQSVGACGTYVISYSVVRDHFEYRESSKLYSLMTGISALAPMLAPIVGGYLAYITNSWRSCFYFLTFVGLAMLINTALSLPDSNRQDKQNYKPEKLLTIFLSKNFLPYALFSGACIIALFGFCCLSPHLLIEQLQVPMQHFGYYFAANAGLLCITNLLSSRLIVKVDVDKLVWVGLGLMLAGSMLMLLLNSFYVLSISNFLPPMLLVSAGIGLGMGPSAACAMHYYKHCTATAASVYGCTQFLMGGIFGTIVLSISHTHARAFAASILLAVLVTGFALIKAPRIKLEV